MEEQKKKEVTGRLAMLLTPEGEIPVMTDQAGNVIQELPVPKVELKALPKEFRPKHHAGIMSLAAFVGMIVGTKRKIPATRDELIEQWGLTKPLIQDLEKMGFVKTRITPLIQAKTGRSVGARAVVFHTPLGHAYIRKVQNEAVQSAGADSESGAHGAGPGLSVSEGNADVSGSDSIVGQGAGGTPLGGDSASAGQPANPAG